MTAAPLDPDPYAELDYRADAGELSEEFRPRSRIRGDALQRAAARRNLPAPGGPGISRIGRRP